MIMPRTVVKEPIVEIVKAFVAGNELAVKVGLERFGCRGSPIAPDLRWSAEGPGLSSGFPTRLAGLGPGSRPTGYFI